MTGRIGIGKSRDDRVGSIIYNAIQLFWHRLPLSRCCFETDITVGSDPVTMHDKG